VIRPAGDGLAAPRSGRNTVENLEAKRICPARNARSAGGIVFAGRLRPWSPATARIHNNTRTYWPPAPEWRHGRLGIPARRLHRPAPWHGQGQCPATRWKRPYCCLRPFAWGVAWKLHCKAGRRVGEPSFVTYRRRTASVEDGTLSCNLRQQAGA